LAQAASVQRTVCRCVQRGLPTTLMSWYWSTFYKLEDSVGHSYDFRRTKDCLDGAGPVISHIEFDRHMISMLFIIIVATPMNAIIVYKYLFEMPPHPKFLLLRWYKFFTHLHIFSGSIEIIAGLAMFFVSRPVPVVMVQASASIVHAVTALALIPLLFGMKLFMNTIYGTGVVMKVILAINVLLNPDCPRRVIALVAFHTVYAWVRVFFVFLRFINVMRYCRYTVAVILASVVVLPVVDRLANAINLCLICLGGLYIGCSSDDKLKVDYTTEFSRDVTTFKHYCQKFQSVRSNHQTQNQHVVSRQAMRTMHTGSEVDLDLLLMQEDAIENSGNSRAKCIFSLVAQKKKHLHYTQLAAMLCSFGMPKSDVTAVMAKYSHGRGTIDFETFHGEMKPLWEYVFFELKRGLKDDDHQEEIVTDANAEFSRLSVAYREHISEQGHMGTQSDEESVTESGYNDNRSEDSFAPIDTSNEGSLSAREIQRAPKNDSRMSMEEVHERLKY